MIGLNLICLNSSSAPLYNGSLPPKQRAHGASVVQSVRASVVQSVRAYVVQSVRLVYSRLQLVAAHTLRRIVVGVHHKLHVLVPSSSKNSCHLSTVECLRSWWPLVWGSWSSRAWRPSLVADPAGCGRLLDATYPYYIARTIVQNTRCEVRRVGSNSWRLCTATVCNIN